MKFANLQEDLKSQKYYPVYFLAGDEVCLIDDGVALLTKALVSPENRDFNFDVFYGSEVSAARVIEIATSYPMLAERRTVIVRETQKMPAGDLNALAGYAARPSPTTHLVLTAPEKDFRKKPLEKLRSVAYFVECAPLYDNQLPGWIQQEAQKLGCTISEGAAQWLAGEVGSNLMYLRSELEKLRLFVGARREMTEEDVAAVTGSQKEFTIYALQDAVGEKNIATALRILDRLLHQKMNAIGILYGLSRYFGHMYVTHGFGRSRDELAKLATRTRMSPYFIPRLLRAAGSYSLAEITHALEILRLCDFAMKTSSISDLLALRLSLIAIVRQLPVSALPFANA